MTKSPKHSANQISTLTQLQIKPACWRVITGREKTYHLEFSYSLDSPEYAVVHTRRHRIKKYKTLDAIFRDIERVQKQANIHYFGIRR